MDDTLQKSAETVALASLATAERMSAQMLKAVSEQQERQQAHLRDTVELIERLLRPQTD